MPFAYYQRLSPRRRAIYRRSAALRTLDLPDPEALMDEVAAVEARLEAGRSRALANTCTRLLGAVCTQLGVEAVGRVKVLAVRPSDATSELHGLYERDEDRHTQITVWMRTAAHERIVAFRTFLRTVLHELCHHLDYELHALADSYHTEGFFARESSLMHQLAPAPEPQPAPPPASVQLELPW